MAFQPKSSVILVCALALGAILPAAAQPAGGAATASTVHPDLSGFWAGPGVGIMPPGEGPPGGGPAGPADPNTITQLMVQRNGDISNLTNDGVIARRTGDSLPLYKPEYWDKVLDLDLNGNAEDTFESCLPMGIPRMGPPRRIVQTATDVHLFYAVPFQKNEFRSVAIGPRVHPVDIDGTWLGDPAAHWDGDTLVIETEGFNDQTWLGAEGYFHSFNLKVTERFRRQGDTLVYDVTADDPDVLQKPWQLPTVTLHLVKAPNFRMEEAPPCSDRDVKHITGRQREM